MSSYARLLLPNGTKLIMIPMQGVGSVATSVMVGVGSRYEEPQISGISHFLEHMVFKGTQKYPSTDEVNIVEKNGGLQNAYTDVDITSYHNKVLAADWQLALDVNSELTQRPLLEQTYVDIERKVIIEEMKRYEDDPAAKVEELFHQLMYPDTWLGRRVIGTEDTLKNIQSHTLKSFHKRWYISSRFVVVIAGQIADEAKVNKFVSELFGSLPAPQSAGFAPVQPPPRSGPAVAILTKPQAQQANLEMGVYTFPRASGDRFGWNVFNVLMGVSFTSRLFRQISEKRGLCYHIRSSSSNWEETGYWSIFAGVANEKALESIAAIKEEITKVVQSGVTDVEVAIAKKRIRTMLAFRSEDPEFMAEFYGRQELYGEPVLELSEYLEKIEAVSTQTVNTLVQTYLGKAPINCALVCNREANSDELQKVLS